MSAAAFKDQGNAFLQAKQFDEAIAGKIEGRHTHIHTLTRSYTHTHTHTHTHAIAAYTEAINLDPKGETSHVFFSNRSAAYLSKGDASSALSDGERCVQVR
jgi:hypothetical protein